MSEEDVKNVVWRVANESAEHVPGWAQEGIVLRAVRDRLSGEKNEQPGLRLQQMILNAWHDLFMEKKLAWGYDLDNPNAPFFHVR